MNPYNVRLAPTSWNLVLPQKNNTIFLAEKDETNWCGILHTACFGNITVVYISEEVGTNHSGESVYSMGNISNLLQTNSVTKQNKRNFSLLLLLVDVFISLETNIAWIINHVPLYTYNLSYCLQVKYPF
jgi:hypothetical protein